MKILIEFTKDLCCISIETYEELLGEYEQIGKMLYRLHQNWFRPAAELDPYFTFALKEAVQAGVKVYCRKCQGTPEQITLSGKLPVVLNS